MEIDFNWYSLFLPITRIYALHLADFIWAIFRRRYSKGGMVNNFDQVCVRVTIYNRMLTMCFINIIPQKCPSAIDLHHANDFTYTMTFLHSAILFCRFRTVERDCVTTR